MAVAYVNMTVDQRDVRRRYGCIHVSLLFLDEYSACEVSASSSEEVRLNTRVAVLVRPEREGDGRKIVHQGDGASILGEVDGAQIAFAGVTGLHADVRKLLSDVHGELRLLLFAAGRAEDSTKIPFKPAKRAHQGTFAAVAFRTQNAEERQGAAERTNARRCIEMRRLSVRGDGFCPRLEEGAGKKLRCQVVFWSVAPIPAPSQCPEVRERSLPCRIAKLGKLARRSGQRRGRSAFDEVQKEPEVREKNDEVELRADAVSGPCDRLVAPHLGNFGGELPLKNCELLIEAQDFCGERRRCNEVLGAADALVPDGGGHFSVWTRP